METLKPCPYLRSDGTCSVWLPKPSGAEWMRKGSRKIIRTCGSPNDLDAQAECDRGRKIIFDVAFAEIDQL